MRYHRIFPTLAVTAAALILTAGLPAPAGAAAPSGIHAVTFEAVDYGFKGPDTLPAGLTSVRMVNRGLVLHHIQLIRLAVGENVGDIEAAFKTEPLKLPAGARFVGGPNAVIPDDSATAIVDLEPGEYVLTCMIPDRKGIPHAAMGMVKALKVSGPAAAKAPEPKAAFQITTMDFSFAVDKPIAPGLQTIRVDNAGTQPHEVIVVRLSPGKSVKDFADAFAPGHTGPPPGRPVGGMTGMEKGAHGYFSATFHRGHYGLICFFPDETRHTPHFVLGMMHDFTVK